MFAEIDGDGNNREQQRGKKKRAQVFAYDISVERKQVYTWFGLANIGNKRKWPETYAIALPGKSLKAGALN